MSTDITRIADVVMPEVFTDYVVQRTMELSELISSGIAQNSAEFDQLASTPGKLVHMPYWDDLTGDDYTMLDAGQVPADKIEAGEDVARKLARVKAFGATGLSAYLSGDDPMRAIGELFAAYWARRYQAMLLATLDGIFAANSMSNKVLDITKQDDNDETSVLTGETFLDALQLMGDAKELLTGVMMHSAVETYLAKRGLIEYYREAEGSPRIATFLGKRVVVDDAMAYDGTNKEGEMYLFGAGAIAWGNGSHPGIQPTELVRDGLSYSGEDILVNRRIAILHPRGVKWTETDLSKEADAGTALPFPTNAALAKGANWSRVFEEKAIRIVKFIFSTDESLLEPTVE